MQVQVSDGNNNELISDLLKKSHFGFGVEIDGIRLLSLYVSAIQSKYKCYIVDVSPSDNTVFRTQADINKSIINDLNKEIKSKDVSMKNFARVKHALDKLFYVITVQGILEYTYQESYLISSSELEKRLNVSQTNIRLYEKLGMESVQGVGHHFYPKHNEFYWKSEAWSSRIQVLYQGFKVRNRSREKLISEIERELDVYQKLYNGTFHEVFGNIVDPYELDEPDDYFEWKELTEDLKKALDSIK